MRLLPKFPSYKFDKSNPWLLETVLVSFAVMYFILAAVLWGGAFWPRVLLVGLSLILLGWVALVWVKAINVIGAELNADKLDFAKVWRQIILGGAIPTFIAKLVSITMINGTPTYHGGIVCDAIFIIRVVYFSVNWQGVLSAVGAGWLILAAVVLVIRLFKSK